MDSSDKMSFLYQKHQKIDSVDFMQWKILGIDAVPPALERSLQAVIKLSVNY